MKTSAFRISILTAIALAGLNAADIANGATPLKTNDSPETLQSASADAESREITRLMAQSRDASGRVTNAVLLEQALQLKAKRQQRYSDELAHSTDPVGTAIKISKDPSADPGAAIKVLEEHWTDSRSEPRLAELAQTGPYTMGDGLMTPAGMALSSLRQVRAKKQIEQVIHDARSDAERTKALIEFLQKRPEIMKPSLTNIDDAVLGAMVLDEVAKSDSPQAVHAVLQSGHIPVAFAKKHFNEMLAYAGSLSSAEAVSNPGLVQRLCDSGDTNVIPLLRKWLPASKSEDQKAYLESAIRDLTNSKK